MNRLGFISCCLCHSLCRASCWRCKKDTHSFTFKKLNHRIDRCRLTCTRSSCQYEETMFNRFYNSSVLHWIQFYLFFLFYFFQTFLHHIFRHLTVNIKIIKHFRSIQFQIIIMCRINANFLIHFFHNCFSLYTQIHNVLLNIFKINSQKCICPSKQYILW